MRNIGVLWLGHGDYLDANTFAVQRAAAACLSRVPEIEAEAGKIAVTEAEAVEAVRDLIRRDLCGAVIVLATWVECNVVMAALKELRGRPCMFWGFPPEEAEGRKESTGSYVSASMFSGVLKRIGVTAPTLLASWKEPDAIAQLSDFAKAAGTVDTLSYAKIGLVGYTSMHIYTGTFDHVMMRWKIGPEIEQMDTYSLIRRAEAADPESVAKAAARLGDYAEVKPDAMPEMLRKTMGLYVALKALAEEGGWQAVNVKCQYELSKEYKAVPCVALSLLAEDGICAGCEGDILCSVSMLMLQSLTGQQTWYGDSLSHTGNTVLFSPCGFLPFSMAKKPVYVQKFMEHPGFTGLQVSGVLREEPVTWMRLVEDVGSYHILYGTGDGVETSPRGGCMPALNVRLHGSMEALCKEYAGQHYALCYGDHAAKIEALARLMGIEARRV